MSSRHRHGSRRGQLTCALLLCAPSVLGQEPVRVPVDLRAPEELDEERTILRGAVLGRRIDILQMLLGEQCLLSGAELDVPDTDGFTLLHLAVRNADAHAAQGPSTQSHGPAAASLDDGRLGAAPTWVKKRCGERCEPVCSVCCDVCALVHVTRYGWIWRGVKPYGDGNQ